MSKINPYSQASAHQAVSQFIPERLPTELILNKLQQEQQVQDAYSQGVTALGDYDQETVYKKDAEYVKEVKNKIEGFSSEMVNADFNNPENINKLLKFRKEILNDENLKNIQKNVGSYRQYVEEKTKIISQGGTGQFFGIQDAVSRHSIEEYEGSEDGIRHVGFNTLQGDLDRNKKREEFFKGTGFSKHLESLGIAENLGDSGYDFLKKTDVKTNNKQIQAARENYLKDYINTPEGRQDYQIFEYKKANDNLPSGVDSFGAYLLDIHNVDKYLTTDITVGLTKLRENARAAINRQIVVGSNISGEDIIEKTKTDLSSKNPAVVEAAIYDYLGAINQAVKISTPLEQEEYNRNFEKHENIINENISSLDAIISHITGESGISLAAKQNLITNLVNKAGIKTGYGKPAEETVKQLVKNIEYTKSKIKELKAFNNKGIIYKHMPKELNLTKDNNGVFNYIPNLNIENIDKLFHDDQVLKGKDYELTKGLYKKLEGTSVHLDNTYSLSDHKSVEDLNKTLSKHYTSLESVGSFAFGSDEDKQAFNKALGNPAKLTATRLIGSDDGKRPPQMLIEYLDGDNNRKVTTFTFNKPEEIKRIGGGTEAINAFELVTSHFGDVGEALQNSYLDSMYTPENKNFNDYAIKNLGGSYSDNVSFTPYTGLRSEFGVAEVNFNKNSSLTENEIKTLKAYSGTTIPDYKGVITRQNQIQVDGKKEQNKVENNYLLFGDASVSLTPKEKSGWLYRNEKGVNALLDNTLNNYKGNNKNRLQDNETKKEIKGAVLDFFIGGGIHEFEDESLNKIFKDVYKTIYTMKFPTDKEIFTVFNSKEFVERIKELE